MRRLLIVLGLILAMSPVVVDEAAALSPYCYLDVTAPYDGGTNVYGAGSFVCTASAGRITTQVCLYQGSVAKQCITKNPLAPYNSGYDVGCAQNPSAGNATFKTWVWVRDGSGNTESLWSVGRTLQGCY